MQEAEPQHQSVKNWQSLNELQSRLQFFLKSFSYVWLPSLNSVSNVPHWPKYNTTLFFRLVLSADFPLDINRELHLKLFLSLLPFKCNVNLCFVLLVRITIISYGALHICLLGLCLFFSSHSQHFLRPVILGSLSDDLVSSLFSAPFHQACISFMAANLLHKPSETPVSD